MKYYYSIFFLILFVLNTNAQIDTAFWFVAPEVWEGHDDRPIYLRFASLNDPAVITIKQPANEIFPTQTINLNANDAQSINITEWIDIIENKPVNQVLNYGLYISSTAPITAYYEEASNNNPDLFALKGKNALGTEFFTPFQSLLNSNYSQSKAGIDIIATEDNTLIQINPTNNLIGYTANSSFTISLNKGQTYSLRSEYTLSELRPSGTHITSNKPISVTMSDDSILGNAYYGGNAYDLLGDQLIPVSKMGHEYIAIKGELNLDDKIYITASENNTNIFLGGTFITNINSGETYEASLINNSMYINTSKPVIVLHMTGYGSEVCGAILPPINCTGSKNVSFIRSENNPFFKINILIKTGSENDFFFNGNSNLITANDFNEVPNTNGEWLFASISEPSFVEILQNSTISNSSDFFHVGIIMGRNSSSRYGYFSNFNEFEHEITSSSESYCIGDNLVLSGESISDVDYVWQGPNDFYASGNNYNFGDLSLADSGTYILSGNIDECEVRSDTLFLSVIPMDNASFSISNFCHDENNSAIVNGLANGTFSLINSFDEASINSITGEIYNSTAGSNYEVEYQTNGLCPNTSTEIVSVLAYENANFTIENFCLGENNPIEIDGEIGGVFSLITNPNGAAIDSVTGELSNLSAGSIYTIEYMTTGNSLFCANSSQQSLEIYPQPQNPDVTTTFNYCANELINPINIANIDPNSTIQWYLDQNLNDLITQAESYQIPISLGSTSIYVTETNQYNCQSLPTEITQNIYPLPEIFAGNDLEKCYGELITLNASGGISYTWNNNIQNNVPENLNVGQYECIVSGNNIYGCYNKDTLIVNIHPTPTPNAGNSSEICGLNYLLNASDNGNSGYWLGNDADILDIYSFSTIVNNSFYGTNTFTWVETNSFGCESSSSVNITFEEQANVNILEDSLFICENDTINIEGTSNNTSLFFWSTNGSGNLENLHTSYVEYFLSEDDIENKEIKIYLRSELGNCFSYDSISININKIPKSSILSDEFLCHKDSSIILDLIVEGHTPITYNLTLNNEVINNFYLNNDSTNVSLPFGIGEYQIINLKDTFCSGNNSEKFKIIIQEVPIAEFLLYPRETSILEPIIYVNDRSYFANNYTWSFGDNSDFFYGKNQSHIYNQAGTFNIKLYVENNFGCKDSLSKEVIIHPNFELYIPNAFTPDNDNINDIFVCKGYGIKKYKLNIHNRWGELVFKTNNIEEGWDGKMVMNGVYVYRIDIIDFLGKNHTFEGEINLIR